MCGCVWRDDTSSCHIVSGINVTAFTTGMLEKRRLDARLYDVLVKLMPAGKLSEFPSEDTLVAAGLASVNEFYGENACISISI